MISTEVVLTSAKSAVGIPVRAESDSPNSCSANVINTQACSLESSSATRSTSGALPEHGCFMANESSTDWEDRSGASHALATTITIAAIQASEFEIFIISSSPRR